MTKIINDVKKIFWVLLTSSFVLGMIFLVSCDDGGDEPEPELYDLSGFYTFKKAELTAGKEDIASALGNPVLAALIPDDITLEMSDGLLAEAPCTDKEKGAVELKSNFKLFFACIGEDNELDAGSWSVDDERTVLSLLLAISTGTLDMKIKDLTIDETNDVVGGSIKNFPITKDLLAGFLAGVDGGDAILAGVDDDITVLVDVDIEFQKLTN